MTCFTECVTREGSADCVPDDLSAVRDQGSYVINEDNREPTPNYLVPTPDGDTVNIFFKEGGKPKSIHQFYREYSSRFPFNVNIL